MKLLLASCGLLSLFVCAVVCDEAEGKHWALLVAGSSGYYNYRHQADICHAYHILHKHGIPDERIVVMMYDDIAHSRQNPFPGNIINKPNGSNLYPGVLKDYTRGEVSPEVFLKVLTGDEEGVAKLLGRNGKVIKSGPNDNVFVNFADHGAPGLIAFPMHVLHAKQLNDAINKMHENKQYKKMVFYIEACESGSMFDKLLKTDINVFATTASNPDESSYACYYDEKRQTYLGDVYSVKWMEDSDKENLETETLQEQFKIVKKETNTSHVMEYGDLSMGQEKVGEFQGNDQERYLLFQSERRGSHPDPTVGAIPSEDVHLDILIRKAAAASGQDKLTHENAIEKLLKRKDDTMNFFEDIVKFVANVDYDKMVKSKIAFTDFECYSESVDMIIDLCPGLNLPQNDYALRNLRAIANLCEMNVSKERIWSVIARLARRSPICRM